MIEITAEVTGSAEFQQRLQESSATAVERVRSRVQQLGLELLRKVKEEQLTGQALRVRTGRLRRSVNEQTTVAGETITSTTGTNVDYGRAWEMGFDRRVGPGARGGVIQPHRHSKAAAAVKHYDARPFLQPAIAEMRDRIFQQLSTGLV